MKILIDENLPRKLAASLEGHECRTVIQCGWSGKQNGDLLAVADPLFEILLTLDKNLPYQQNLDSVRIGVLIIHAYSNRRADLLPLLAECLVAVETIQPRKVHQRQLLLPKLRVATRSAPLPTLACPASFHVPCRGMFHGTGMGYVIAVES